MLTRRKSLITFATAGLYPQKYSLAHGAHTAFTIIEKNARAGTLEVIHRLMVLDLELALTARTGRRISMEDLADESGNALVSDYLNDYFSISSNGQEKVRLQWVGMALEVNTLFAYQEAPLPEKLSGLIISNQLLTETHPSQVNTVNVTFDGRTQSRMFVLDDAPKQVDVL